MALKAAEPRTCSIDGCDRTHVARGLCRPHYMAARDAGTLPPKTPRVGKQRCLVDGCDRWRTSHGYCATHWRRIERHGDPAVVLQRTYKRSGSPTLLRNGYLMVYEPEHPLANPANGQVLEHRKVLYDLIGDGSHPCHICTQLVTWGASRPDRLDVDHLDGNRKNNDPANLAVACPPCNDQRRT